MNVNQIKTIFLILAAIARGTQGDHCESIYDDCTHYVNCVGGSNCCPGLDCDISRRRLEDSIEGHDVERKLHLTPTPGVCVCDGLISHGESCTSYPKGDCCDGGLVCQTSRRLEGSIEGHDVERKLQVSGTCQCDGPPITENNNCIDYGDGVSCCDAGLECEVEDRRLELEGSIEGHDVERKQRKLGIQGTCSGPSDSPTKNPTDAPTDTPTKFPTKNPTDAPTDTPTKFPTKNPTDAPTDTPTDAPTDGPTKIPTESPETTDPSQAPTDAPVKAVTAVPTDAFTDQPTVKAATAVPTKLTMDAPVKAATGIPTKASSGSDVTEAPSAVGKDKKEVIYELFLIHLTLLLKKGKTITIHDFWSDKFYNLEYFLNYLHKAHPALEGTGDDLEGMKIKLTELLEEETGGHGRALLERIHADMDKGTAHGGLRNAAAALDNGIDMEGMKAKIMDVLDKMDE